MDNAREFIRGFKAGFVEFGHGLSGIVNFILLSLVYFLGVGFTSIAGKLLGKHFLNLKKVERKSYWVEKNLSKEEKESYYRMF